MNGLKMDMICEEIPFPENDSIILAFAGAFTGTTFDKGHSNMAGDHVAGGTRFKGYRSKRNNGAFTWSAKSGPRFFYKDYSSALDKAAKEGGMGFAQEMMIHDGATVPTIRPLGNRNVFALYALIPTISWLFTKAKESSLSKISLTLSSLKELQKPYTQTWDKIGTTASIVSINPRRRPTTSTPNHYLMPPTL